MATTLITGCDYGIGFELARQYAADGWMVHAVCLQPASQEKVETLGPKVRFHTVDVGQPAQVTALADSLSSESIDLLISNAATFAPDGPGPLELPNMDEFTRVMRINAVAPVYLAQSFVEHVASSDRRTMAFLSTRSGSIGDNGTGGHYAYRCSKAALNMAVKSLSVDLRERGILSVALHPGSVRTETRKSGQIDVQTSVHGLREVIDNLNAETSGTFRRYDGGVIEW